MGRKSTLPCTECDQGEVRAKHRSFWLQEAANDAADEPALSGVEHADVVIVGGGYVGLWTAIRIKEDMPACDVVLLEQDICGGGASGRNGGFVLSWASKFRSLAKLYGDKEAVRIVRESQNAIQEIQTFCHSHQIEADFRKGGWLWTATTEIQMEAWDSVVRACEENGLSGFQRLPANEVAQRTGSAIHRAGVFAADAAIVQPALLVRGLRRVALQLGVRIFEHTRVRRFTRGRPVELQSDSGKIVADKLVIANNAWSASIPELSRSIAVISSDMIVTAPVPQRLRQIGWHRDLSISDSQIMIDYYRITRDGRIAFGKGGWTIAYGGHIGPNFDRHRRRAKEVTADFRRYYPQLNDVPITHDWSGPIDRTPDSLPIIGYLGEYRNICYGVGWSGNGVGPSVIGGRILASMALERNDQWKAHPLVGRSARSFPPEPLRFIGAHFVRAAVASKERAEWQNKKPSRLAVQFAKLAPAGLEDK
jgi:putative aminophosphonate oxidoreductase